MIRFLALLSLVLVSGVLAAATPIGGLTVAVSPSGDDLVAGGDSRTLYGLNAAALSVTKRQWFGATITNLAYTPDGAALMVGTTDGEVIWLDAGDWSKQLAKVKAARPSFAPAAGLLAGADSRKLVVYAMADGAAKLTIELGDFRTSTYGLSADGTTLVVISDGKNDDAEPKKARSERPEDLSGIDRDIWTDQNDGRMSTVRFYNVADGSIKAEHKLWYTPRGGSLVGCVGDEAVVITYSGLSGKIGADGTVTPFKLMHGLNYGHALNASHEQVAGGNLRSFSVTTLADLTGNQGKLDKLPGWPEYFEGFAFAADGTIYAGTSGYRVARIAANGTLEAVVPVY